MSPDRGSPGILFSSIAHSPKSINLQRSQQKGLNGCSAVQGTGCLQVGHFTISGLPDDGIRTDNGLRRKEYHLGFGWAVYHQKTVS